MSKHTAGPWQFGSVNGDVFATDHIGLPPAVYTRFLITTDTPGAVELVAMTPTKHAEFNQRSEADARLIAAAPDLLGACRACADHLRGRIVGRPVNLTSLRGLSEACAAAIAKAEGGAA